MTHQPHSSTPVDDGATIEQRPLQAKRQGQGHSQGHPYLMATITPSGGLIVHMHWLEQPAEPLAFTNEADFSAWLKGAVHQCSQRIPAGIRPMQRAGSLQQHLPLPEAEFDSESATARRRGGISLGGLLRGRA
jgi:hypothetical protein